MKKIVLTSMAMVLGAVLAHAQGLISMTVLTPAVTYNNGVSNNAPAAGSAWSYEVLDMTAQAYSNLTAQAQGQAYNLLNNNSAFSLWTDSTVSGTGQNLASHAGGINSSGSATAVNWAAPTSGAGYTTAANWDYYTILGWNTALGSWATVEGFLNAGTLAGQTGFFGQSAVAYNYAGGSGLAAVSLFAPAATTGLAGSGGLGSTGVVQLQTLPVPEPTTLALAGLGGISMLFLRRRKA